MAYSVELRPSAARALKKLEGAIQKRIIHALVQLERDPFPPGVKKLISEEDVYRGGVGDFRIIYQVESAKVNVLVLRIGHRREIYR